MKKIILLLFCLLFSYLSFSTTNEEIKKGYKYIHYDLTDETFTARLDQNPISQNLIDFEVGHYNFAGNPGGIDKRYLNDSSCILTYSNKLNANWNTDNDEAKNIFISFPRSCVGTVDSSERDYAGQSGLLEVCRQW